jgi:hypothetical protein
VLGIVASGRGNADTAIARCREAVSVAPNAQARALATLYLCVAMLDAGETTSAISTALDAVAEGHVSGVDASFGAYVDALAADGLTRLGRWTEARQLLARHAADTALPIGYMRVARTTAILAARQGDDDLATSALRDMRSVPVDGWHQALVDVAAIEIELARGNWSEAVAVADSGWDTRPDAPVWAARIAGLGAHAVVEAALDARAARTEGDMENRASEASGRLRRRGKLPMTSMRRSTCPPISLTARRRSLG